MQPRPTLGSCLHDRRRKGWKSCQDRGCIDASRSSTHFRFVLACFGRLHDHRRGSSSGHGRSCGETKVLQPLPPLPSVAIASACRTMQCRCWQSVSRAFTSRIACTTRSFMWQWKSNTGPSPVSVPSWQQLAFVTATTTKRWRAPPIS